MSGDERGAGGFELLVREQGSVTSVDDVLRRSDGCSVETVMDVLAHRRRRYVLYHLRENGTAVAESLADHIAEQERDGSTVMPDPARRQHLRTELLHVHLPKLDDAGAITFERTGEFVEYDASETLELFVELAARAEA
ncbi:DUF7344 domain-containing protein [Halomicrococcus sp. NG-SE-24]|uniref:DUF7344 domain-containing protein n=1 Tax=Halomicrococcus sp. NG-SE-24 TaxID=3436928 RepID=UPI003D99DB4B